MSNRKAHLLLSILLLRQSTLYKIRQNRSCVRLWGEYFKTRMCLCYSTPSTWQTLCGRRGNQILFSPHFRPLQCYSRDNWRRKRERHGSRGPAPSRPLAWHGADSIPAHFYAFINPILGPNDWNSLRLGTRVLKYTIFQSYLELYQCK